MDALEQVRRYWHALAVRQGWSERAAAAVLEGILVAYRAPHRHYHTLEHLAALLALLRRHAGAMADHDALILAILFHDIVYDPARQDNEEASAKLAAERLACLGASRELTHKVARFIVATRHDQIAGAIAADADLALLLDLDLSILGAAPGDYRGYAAAVRREYAFVPDPIYNSGRGRVLLGFLARERIYRTQRLAALWEQPARDNLAAEIAELT